MVESMNMPSKSYAGASANVEATVEEQDPSEEAYAVAGDSDPVVSTFDRALDPRFIDKLRVAANTGGWWSDVLNDAKLVVALRGKSLDVYWRGMSLFHVMSRLSDLTADTHAKYLLDPRLNSRVNLNLMNMEFEIDDLKAPPLIRIYENFRTLDLLKKAATIHSSLEKAGCHEIAVRNSNVIDCEIAFPGFGRTGRIDLASLEESDRAVRLVFWEAKHFWNGDLRSNSGKPAVCEQIEKYRAFLATPEHRNRILSSYTKVIKNMVEIRDMGWKRKLPSLFDDVAAGKKSLVIDDRPKVGLLIFGFKAANEKDPTWREHLGVLRERLGIPGDPEAIVIVGNAKNRKLPTKKVA
jgi:hypothetical protein